MLRPPRRLRAPSRRLRAAPAASWKCFIRSRAVTAPTWRMPSPNSSRAASGARLRLDSWRAGCRPTFPSSLPAREFRRAAACRRKMSAGHFQPAEREELGDGLLAQPLDIERGAADEMLQPLELLRRADQPAGAAHIDFAFLGHRLAAAFGAMVGEIESGRGPRRASGSRPPAGSRRPRAGSPPGRPGARRAARSRRDCAA